MDVEATQRWLDRYVEAWRSYDPDAIRALFTEDADYYTAPFRKPWHGHGEILAGWEERRDAPDSWECEYEAIAATDDTGVGQGWTRYFTEDRSGIETEYANVFVMRFESDGPCREFTEFYFKRPSPSKESG
jgi:SnoaL-like domain